MFIIDPAPRLGVYYFLSSVCMYVCPSVGLSRCSFKSILFFVSRWNRTIFWPTSLHVALYKTLFFDYWFRSPNAQNLLSKIEMWVIESVIVCGSSSVGQRNLGCAESSRLPACLLILSVVIRHRQHIRPMHGLFISETIMYNLGNWSLMFIIIFVFLRATA